MPLSIVHIQSRKVRVLRIVHTIETARNPLSMSPSVFSGAGTGQQGLSFPRPTFLRRRYKTLQRRQFSSQPSSGQEVPAETSATQLPASLSAFDPSFQAIRALNRPEPTVVHALINDPEEEAVADEAGTTPSEPADPERARLASSEHDSRSFSSRIDRLMRALDRGQRIRFSSPDQSGRVDAFARGADQSSETAWSEHSVTRQIARHPENFGRILGPDSQGIRSPSSNVSDVDLPGPSQVGYTVRRTGTPVISEDQRRSLIQRIRDKIAESVEEDQQAPSATVIHRKRRRVVDPRVVRTAGRNGVERHRISPIPLNYGRTRGLQTPSIGSSGSRSDLSSALGYVVSRDLARAHHPASSSQSNLSRNAAGATESDSGQPVLSEAGSTQALSGDSGEVDEDRVGGQEKSRRIVSWLRRVSSALKPSEDSPARKFGRAIGVFHDKPSGSSDKQAMTPANRSLTVLQDVTNVRKPGYLESNSFAQEQEWQGTKIRNRKQAKQRLNVVPVHASAKSYVQANWPHAEVDPESAGRAGTKGSSKRSSVASTVKPAGGGDELHPDVAFALARLEGRVPPPPSSPFQIRRSRNDTDSYGPDVEVELGELNLDSPQPLIPVQSGEWSGPLEKAVDEGFDCAIEAPEEDWGR